MLDVVLTQYLPSLLASVNDPNKRDKTIADVVRWKFETTCTHCHTASIVQSFERVWNLAATRNQRVTNILRYLWP